VFEFVLLFVEDGHETNCSGDVGIIPVRIATVSFELFGTSYDEKPKAKS
jgi:hypothetical protein